MEREGEVPLSRGGGEEEEGRREEWLEGSHVHGSHQHKPVIGGGRIFDGEDGKHKTNQ